MADTVVESNVWGVNADGEIVAVGGKGPRTVTSYIDTLGNPKDDSNRVVINAPGIAAGEYTSATRPAANTVAAGTEVIMTDDGRRRYYSDGSAWVAVSGAGGGATNLTTTAAASQVTVNSDTGTDAVIPAADGTNAGVMTSAMQTKLAGIAAGATANSSDATLLARANHTGTQAAATISDFSSAADARVAAAAATGTGDLVRASSPTIASPNVTGVPTKNGAEVITPTAMAALTIDTAKPNTKSIAADSTFLFSSAPAANTWFTCLVTNTDAAPHRVTLPTCFNMSTGTSAAHVVVIQAGGKLYLVFNYDGTTYNFFGDSGYLNKYDATVAPTVNDDIADGYGPGSGWLDATGNAFYICESNATGAAVWHNLSSVSGVTDGDKVDITVSNSGATWTIDNDAVTYAKMQDVSATDRLLGRSTAGAGNVEEITCTAAGRALLDDADAAAQRTTLGVVGKQLIPVMAGGMSPSTTGGCAALTTIASAADQPDIQTLNFDPTTQEFAQFAIPMPESWDEGTLTYQVLWSHAATATNFGAVFSLQAVAVSDDDPIAVAYGTAVQVADTGGTTNDLYVSPESTAITVAGTPANKDTVFFRLARVPADAADDLAVDARVHGIRLYYTTNAAIDA